MKATREAKAATVGAVSPEQVAQLKMFQKLSNLNLLKLLLYGAEDVAKVPETAVVEAASGTVSEDWRNIS